MKALPTPHPKKRAHSCIRRILLFPRGNNQKKAFSFYLEVADPKDGSLADDWHICAEFAVAISNPKDTTNYFSNSKFFSLVAYTHKLNLGPVRCSPQILG